MQNKLLLFSLALFSSFCLRAQRSNDDTSFYYAVMLFEKQTFDENPDGSIISGHAFDSICIATDKGDTIDFRYIFPYITFKKADFHRLIRLSTSKDVSLQHIFSCRNSKRQFTVSVPFDIIFDRYWTNIYHERLKSGKFKCTMSAYSDALHTTALSFTEGRTILRRRLLQCIKPLASNEHCP